MGGKRNKYDFHGGDDYEKNAYRDTVYKDSRWPEVAKKYEIGFAANLYKASFVREAAHTALTKLSSVLNAYYGMKSKMSEENAASVEALNEVAATVSGDAPLPTAYLREALLSSNNNQTSAGQVGNYEKFTSDTMKSDVESGRLTIDDYNNAMKTARDMDNQNINDVMNKDGNLREMMTMIYNGTFINGGRNKDQISKSHSLKNLVSNITLEDQERLRQIGEASGNDSLKNLNMDFDIINAHRDNGSTDYFDTSATAKLVKNTTDKRKGKGNFISRTWQGVKRWFSAHNIFRGKNSVKTDAERQERKLGRDHYENLGVGLSDREKAFAGANGDLPWLEGRAWNKMDKASNADGMLNVAGASGTTLRMLSAYKMLGASKTELLYFRLALIAWMVTGQDHSISEILEGSHNVGLKGYEDMSEAATMYATIDPLDRNEIREGFAPNKEFPHETMFKLMLSDNAKKRDESQAKRNEKIFAKNEVVRTTYENFKTMVVEYTNRHGDLGAVGKVLAKHGSTGSNFSEIFEKVEEDFNEKREEYGPAVDDLNSWKRLLREHESYKEDVMNSNNPEDMVRYESEYARIKKTIDEKAEELKDVLPIYEESKNNYEILNDYYRIFNATKVLRTYGVLPTGEIGGENAKINFGMNFNLFHQNDYKSGDTTDVSALNAQTLAAELYTTGLSQVYMNTAQRHGMFVAKYKFKNEKNNTQEDNILFKKHESFSDITMDIAKLGRLSSRLFYEKYDEQADYQLQNMIDKSDNPDLKEDNENKEKENTSKGGYVGTVYRADADLKRYSGRAGAMVYADGLSSTTKNASVTGQYYTPGGVILKIHLKGYSAWDVSQDVYTYGNKSKEEVILPRDAAFKIIKSKEDAMLYGDIYVTESELGNYPEQVRDMYEGAVKFKMVELEEMPNKHNADAFSKFSKRKKRLDYRKKLEQKAKKRA